MHSIDKVIIVYESISQAYSTVVIIPAVLLWIIVGVYSLMDMIKNNNAISSTGFIMRWLFFVMTLSIVGFLSINIITADFSMNEKQWKNNYLDPYINALPENKTYVQEFTQILEIHKNGNKKIESIYLNKKVKPIWVELDVLDKNNASETIAVQTIIQKEPIDEPYLTYKAINKNISKEYPKNSYYETILHIPEEYKVLVPAS
ncbi:hypothetical protein ACQKMD_18410 [Viridibacillus sp. NPDC096237]|uniref:hypothetical protein n=1 Tax=Viridibacillus sp. NPDC096237 TaxID=3390721 RepID=UPI003D0807DA